MLCGRIPLTLLGLEINRNMTAHSGTNWSIFVNFTSREKISFGEKGRDDKEIVHEQEDMTYQK